SLACPLPEGLVIFGDEAFYRGRPEPEEPRVGRLRARAEVGGPASRSLPFELAGEDFALPVYAGGDAAERLRRHVAQPVVVCSKLIDLRPEGFGVELWIGSLRGRP
ncbi:MAG: hypothetical protein K0S42_2616, partial [Microvirga sp.]|nr:hypothetical protein [Microvirga sp.]